MFWLIFRLIPLTHVFGVVSVAAGLQLAGIDVYGMTVEFVTDIVGFDSLLDDAHDWLTSLW